LRLVDYNIVTKNDIPEFIGLSKVKDDEHIIPWLADHDAIWIHADDNAKVEHAKMIVARQVRTVWVWRKGGRMSQRDQLRILAYILPDILDRFRRARHRHYEVRVHGEPPHQRISIKDFQLY